MGCGDPRGRVVVRGAGTAAGVCCRHLNLELLLSFGLEEHPLHPGGVKGPSKSTSRVQQSWTSI